MNIFFKSLSGDIFTIPLNSELPYLPRYNLPSYIDDSKELTENYKKIEKWNKIRILLSREINCEFDQIVILNENEEIPEIFPNQVYNFFIRDKEYLRDDLHISLNFFETYYESSPYSEEQHPFYKYTAQLYEKKERIQEFYFYYDKLSNKFYHQDSILSSGTDFSISIKTLCSDSSLYNILYEKLSIPWYDKNEIIERVMVQLDYILNYNDSDHED